VIKWKIAILGLGRIGLRHLEAIQRCDEEFELVAICDNDEARLDASGCSSNVKKFNCLGAMLTSGVELDYVAVCTPSGLHAEHTIRIANAGVSVITEKPMATRWNDARQMIEVCDSAGVNLYIVKQNRLNPTLQLLKRAVGENRFGKIHLVQSNVFWTRPQSYYDQAEWRGTWEFDGGALMNQASHYVDLLDWLVGPVEFVNACSTTFRKIEVEDTAVVNLGWRNGALGSMAVTMLTFPENLEGSITILGEKGSVIIGGIALNQLIRWDFQSETDYDADVAGVSYAAASVYGNGHFSYYSEIIKAHSGLPHSLATGRDGLRTMELLVAAYLSAREKKTIYLPLEL